MEITIAKVLGMVVGRVKILDAILVMVEEQMMTPLLTAGVRLVGAKTVAPLMRMDVHAVASPDGLRTRDVAMALWAASASAVRTTSVATSFVAFAMRAVEDPEGTVGDSVTNDKTLGGWSAVGAGDNNLVAPPALVLVGMLSFPNKSAAPPAKFVNGTRSG